MDFGDILNEWDKIEKARTNKKVPKKQNQVSHKKANAPTKEEKLAAQKSRANTTSNYDYEMTQDAAKKINPMELWLRRYGTVDKDKEIEHIEQEEKTQTISYIRALKPDAYIDLHGLTKEEAERKLNVFVTDSVRRGFRKILIIHGKGIHSKGSDPVLGDVVRKFIERDKRLGTSGKADKYNGGGGATWVIIRN